MKKFLVILLLGVFTACTHEEPVTFVVTYTDGTQEVIQSHGDFYSDGSGNIGYLHHGCLYGRTFTRCGVRKFYWGKTN